MFTPSINPSAYLDVYPVRNQDAYPVNQPKCLPERLLGVQPERLPVHPPDAQPERLPGRPLDAQPGRLPGCLPGTYLALDQFCYPGLGSVSSICEHHM
jgi:hypothetical protein